MVDTSIFTQNQRTWLAMCGGLDKRIENIVGSGFDLRYIDLHGDPKTNNYVSPAAMPFVNEEWLDSMFSLLATDAYLTDEDLLTDPGKWEFMVKMFNGNRFLCRNHFLEKVSHPLFLRLRQILKHAGLDLGTEPSSEKNVLLPDCYSYPNFDVLTEAYPEMETFEVIEKRHRRDHYPDFRLYPYLTEAEMDRVYPASGLLRIQEIDDFSEKILGGRFHAPEAFVSKCWSGPRREGRLTAIRRNPGMIRFMTKADMFHLLDVRGVLKHCLDHGWVTRFNHDKVFNALQTDEDRAILLEWDNKNNMQDQMKKLEETRMSSDPFSTTTMRKDWFVCHKDGGVYLRLKSYVSSEILYIPSKVGGVPVLHIQTPMENDHSEGSIWWTDVKSVMVDSELPYVLLKPLRSSKIWDQRMQAFGEGDLRIVPGAILKDNTICYSLGGPELDLPEGIEDIPEGIFNGRDYERIHLPLSLKKIGEAAFSFCHEIKEADIPCPVETSAFEGCSGLEKVRINGNIGKRAFFGAKSLRQIEVGPSCRFIGDEAFSGWYDDLRDSDIAELRLFRVNIGRMTFKNRRIRKAEFIGCEFGDPEPVRKSYPVQVRDMNLVVDELYLTRCWGILENVAPSEQAAGLYRGKDNHVKINTIRYGNRSEDSLV